MTKIRRGNYIFVSWIGDHGRHVHVYRDGKEILRWDLDLDVAISGRPTRRLRTILRELIAQGRL